uniref:Putative secreted protein n=1 Tax=Anopheles darlingi TaxID=43151 RepID=A0A2M4DJF3_ANODA
MGLNMLLLVVFCIRFCCSNFELISNWCMLARCLALILRKYSSRSPHPTYSIIIVSGCLIVQQPSRATMFGCWPTFFIILISSKNSSSLSAEGHLFNCFMATIFGPLQFGNFNALAMNTLPNAPLPISRPMRKAE